MVARGINDTSSFALATASVSTPDTEGATLRFGKLRLRHVAAVLPAGAPPVHCIMYVRHEQRWESLASKWIRGPSDMAGASDGVRWDGNVLTERDSGVWCRVRNDTGSTVTTFFSFWGESV